MNNSRAHSVVDAPDRFARHPSMPFLMGGAHRKPADKVGPPALMRHVTLWRPSDQAQPGVSRQHLHDQWLQQIEGFILALYFRLSKSMQDAGIAPPTITNLLQKDHDPHRLELLRNIYRNDPDNPVPIGRIKGITRHETVRIVATWQSIPLQISFERHTEYFTFTTIMDLCNRSMDGRYDEANPIFAKLLKALRVLDAVGARSTREINPIPEATARRLLIPSYDALYYAIWERLREDVYGPALDAATKSRPEQLGRVVGDFRGILLERQADDGASQSFVSICPGRDSKTDPTRVPEVAATRRMRKKQALRSIEGLLPFMLASPRHRDKPYSAIVHELTFSWFTDRRCIYASALSSQSEENTEGTYPPITPLTYLLLCPNRDRWQLGRVIDRLHNMGTLRVAALYGLDDVTTANFALVDLERDVDASSRLLPDRVKSDEGLSTAVDDILALSLRLTDITSNREDGVPGGLQYRTERSAYYVQQFNELLKFSRVDRIKGFQPYDQLVRRRMGAGFDAIRMAGIRYARVAEKITELTHLVRANEVVKQQKKLAEQANAATHTQQRIEHLQTTAEQAFFLVLFPYYSGFLMMEIINVEILKLPILLGAVALGIALAFRRERVLCTLTAIAMRAKAWLDERRNGVR